MSKVVDHDKIRNELLDATVEAGARYGLSGITNQTIKELSGQKEAYVYRYFIDRDDMITKAFFRSDENFFSYVERIAPILVDPTIEKGRHRFVFFRTLLDYSLEDTKYTLFYTRYYYSAMFDEKQREQHRQICEKHFTPFRHIFAPDADCYFILHQAFSTLLANVMDFATSSITNTEENKQSVVNHIVKMINAYLADGEKL